MINYDLPKVVEIDGEEYSINNDGDYRMVLDVISALKDNKMKEQERAVVALNIFYNFDIPNNAQKAYDVMCDFVDGINGQNGSSKSETNTKPLMDWEFDFPLIVSALNKVLGYDIRSKSYIHWWTILAAYMEIDDKSLYSQVLTIRMKKQKGKKLDDCEREFYNANRKIIDLPIQYTQEEEDLFNKLTGKEVE